MRSDLFWAVVDHARTWLGEDGPFRHAIEKQNGRLDGATLRRVAIAYNVSRGIKKENSEDSHAEAIAELINRAPPWPSALSERANRCLKIAKVAKSRGHTDKLQASAMTKFSWFSDPAEWTVYDRFVAHAMNASGQDTQARLLNFYAALEKRRFTELTRHIQAELDEWKPMPLFGARVLDKLMMLHGARELQPRWADNTISIATSFLEVLPAEWRDSVEHVAGKVERAIDARAFLHG